MIPRIAWLIGGTVALGFGQGHWPNPVLLVAGVALVARFFVAVRLRWSIPAFVLAHACVWEFAYRGMVPLPLAARLGMEAGVSLVLALVFAIDSRIAHKSKNFARTLVLPCGWVAFDLMSARLSPGGTWGSLAYSLVEPLALGQVAALVGWTGLTFLIVWTASTINWVMVTRGRRRVIGAAVYLGVAVLTLVHGAIRLRSTFEWAPQLRTACVVAPSTYDDENLERVWAYTRGAQISNADVTLARARIAASMDEHFAAVKRAIDSEADLIVWAEANPSLTDAEEDTWIERARKLARERKVWIGLSLFVFRPNPRRPSKNSLVLVAPDGEVAFEFLKAKRTPGATHAVGDGRLPVQQLGSAKISAAICFDLDFPQLFNQAGRAGVDLLLAPSNDWEEVAATHARMAQMRAIEQGFGLLRPTKDGFALVTDSVGRILGRRDTSDSVDSVLITDIPLAHTPTLYSQIGDAFAWACVAAILLALVALLRLKGTQGVSRIGFTSSLSGAKNRTTR